MKKLFTVLVLGLALTSCTDTAIKVEDPKKETTIELQQLASIDSTTYKVVEKDNTVYILSTKDNMVVKKVQNESGKGNTFFCILIVVILAFWLMLAIVA